MTKTLTIEINDVPEKFLKGLLDKMVSAKLDIDKEVMVPPDKIVISMKDMFIERFSAELFEQIIASAFSLYAANPDGKKTPDIEIEKFF